LGTPTDALLKTLHGFVHVGALPQGTVHCGACCAACGNVCTVFSQQGWAYEWYQCSCSSVLGAMHPCVGCLLSPSWAAIVLGSPAAFFVSLQLRHLCRLDMDAFRNFIGCVLGARSVLFLCSICAPLSVWALPGVLCSRRALQPFVCRVRGPGGRAGVSSVCFQGAARGLQVCSRGGLDFCV
jgi:hypothetical protein